MGVEKVDSRPSPADSGGLVNCVRKSGFQCAIQVIGRGFPPWIVADYADYALKLPSVATLS